MKILTSVLVVFGLVLWATMTPCVAEQYVVTQLTNNTSDDFSPDINAAGHVVWAGYEGADQEIFLYNGDSTIVLQNDSWNDADPHINVGGRVVWTGGTDSGKELFFYDGSSIARVTNNSLEDTDPQINVSGVLAWLQHDGNDYEVFRYRNVIQENIQLTDNDVAERNPRINSYGSVVWQGYDGHDDEIFMYNSVNGNTIQLTYNDYDDENPEINYHGRVVWSGDGEIFFYSNGITTQITNNTTEDRSPHINYNGHVVWLGNDFVVDQVMLYDGVDITAITNNGDYKLDARISDNGSVVWIQGESNSSSDIFLYDGTEIKNLSNSPILWEINPQINSRGVVVWESRDYTTGEIFYASPVCQPDFTATPLSGMAPLAVQFEGTTNVYPVSWSWDFDNDGTEDSTQQNPIYTYASAGTYTPNLTISGPCGSVTETKVDYIDVSACQAEFLASPLEGLAPLAVQFTDLSGGDINTWSWDFDNDGLEDSAEQDPVYTYESGGMYTVSLTVSGLCGQVTKTKVDYLHLAANKADFTASPREGLAPLIVQFTDLSVGDFDAWSWDLDNDGSEDSAEQNPVYTYNTPGPITVRLTVSSPNGQDEEVKANYIRALRPYTRPAPVMDYAPQEIGIYDTRYIDRSEYDCRTCHGDNLADRHHYSEQADNCALCHDPVPQKPEDWPPGDPWPSSPWRSSDPYPPIERNCLASGCHSWDDVETYGWHHNGIYTGENRCNICHDRDYIETFGPGVSFTEAPPNVTPPLVAACENCHWNQNLVEADGENNPPAQGKAAHPSTYDHLDPWGHFIGYFEYPLPLNNIQSSHMKEKSGFGSTCTMCHSVDDVTTNFDPTEAENIRACERCHSKETLHTVHMQSINSWEAVGFHTSETANTVPDTYRVFTAQEMCTGCHGYVPAVAEIYKLKPKSVRPGMALKIVGNNFGITQADSILHIGNRSFDSTSRKIKLWSNTKIKLLMPKFKNKWYKGKDFRRKTVWVTVTGIDSNEKKLKIFRPCKCDLNKDGICNDDDVIILGADMNRTDCGETGVKCKGDINRDDAVDAFDADIFMEAYERVDCGTM